MKTTNVKKKPWNEILPLYNKGDMAALNALDQIILQINVGKKQDVVTYLSTSSLHQEEAIKYWKMANQQSTAKKEEEQKETKSKQEESKTAAENALQLLQEMQSGKQMRKTYPNLLKQEVERPW